MQTALETGTANGYSALWLAEVGQDPVFASSLVPVGRGEWLLVRHDPEPARFPLLTHPLAIFVSHYLA